MSTRIDPPELTRTEFLERVDHTLLAPATTRVELEAFLRAALELGVRRVCISPSLLPVDTFGLEIVTVVGFPAGSHQAEVKAAEAAHAVADGAAEIDMVANRALIRAEDWGNLAAEVRAVRDACPGALLKVILETAALDREEIIGASRAAQRGGADFVKTSTGFDPAGGASEAAVRAMVDAVGGDLGVKASGGIRTAEAVRRLWAAGATRFGLSATEHILRDWDAGDRSTSVARETSGADGY